MKSYRAYVVVLVILLVTALLSEAGRDEPVNWDETYTRSDKIPYGTWILYEQLDEIFPGRSIEVVDQTPYSLFREASVPTDAVFVFINNSINFPEDQSDALLKHIAGGGTVMIAADRMDGAMFDSLGVETETVFWSIMETETRSVETRFTSPTIGAEASYRLALRDGYSYFKTVSADESYVVETLLDREANDESESVDARAIAVRIEFGAGTILLSSVPGAFTNYTLLDPAAAERASLLLSYLPVADVMWDEFYKPQGYADVDLDGGDQSIARYIRSREPLRLAWYLLLASGALFVLFGLKRRQRPIPIVEPPRNATLDFVRTVGTLYHQSGDFANLATKQRAYLFDFIRTHLNIPTTHLNNEFVAQVADRSGMDVAQVDRLMKLAAEFKSDEEYVEASRLMAFTDAIEEFYDAVEKNRGITATQRYGGDTK